MQGFWCGHGAPVVFNGENGGKRLDLFSTHVNDERQVVGIAVSFNSQTFNVNPPTRKRFAESLVVQQTSGQGGDERFNLLVRDRSGLSVVVLWKFIVVVVHERSQRVVDGSRCGGGAGGCVQAQCIVDIEVVFNDLRQIKVSHHG